MKKTIYLYLRLLSLSIVTISLFIQCTDAENGVIDNLIYISEASTSKAEEVVLQTDGDSQTAISVRIAQALGHDIHVNISMDSVLLNEYNKMHETNYQMIPEDHISYINQAVIKAGNISSDPIVITVRSLETSGTQYAIPLAITSAEGEVSIAQSSSKFILILVKPLQQDVPTFRYFNKMQAEPLTEWGLLLPNYTLEWWCKMSGFSVNNQAIINSGAGGTELYIRFGDLVYAQNNSYVYNFLQVKTMGTQFDSGDPTQGKGLIPNQWYHFAITYDAATGTSLLYVDGSVVAQLGTEVGKLMRFDRFQIVSSGQQYFKDRCELAQIRLWKTTRSANQIRKNMYSTVEYNNKDLVLYLPMDKVNITSVTEGDETKTIFKDVTQNGHDVEVGNMMKSNDSGYRFRHTIAWNNYLFAQ